MRTCLLESMRMGLSAVARAILKFRNDLSSRACRGAMLARKVASLASALALLNGALFPNAAAALADPGLIPAQLVQSNSFKELLQGPENPEDGAAWRAGMLAYRQQMQARLDK